MPLINYVLGPYSTVNIDGTEYTLTGSQDISWSYDGTWNYNLNSYIQVGPQKLSAKVNVIAENVQSSPGPTMTVTFTHADGHTLILSNCYVRAASIRDSKTGAIISSLDIYTENLGNSPMITVTV